MLPGIWAPFKWLAKAQYLLLRWWADDLGSRCRVKMPFLLPPTLVIPGKHRLTSLTGRCPISKTAINEEQRLFYERERSKGPGSSPTFYDKGFLCFFSKLFKILQTKIIGVLDIISQDKLKKKIQKSPLKRNNYKDTTSNSC